MNQRSRRSVEFIEAIETGNRQPLTDSPTCRHLMPLILILTLSFTLRLAGVSRLRPARSEIRLLCGDPGQHTLCKLHAMLTDYSPLHMALFTDRAAAARWLGVPLEMLSE